MVRSTAVCSFRYATAEYLFKALSLRRSAHQGASGAGASVGVGVCVGVSVLRQGQERVVEQHRVDGNSTPCRPAGLWYLDTDCTTLSCAMVGSTKVLGGNDLGCRRVVGWRCRGFGERRRVSRAGG